MASTWCVRPLASVSQFAGPSVCSGCTAEAHKVRESRPVCFYQSRYQGARAVTAEAGRLGGVRCQRKTAPDPLRWIQRRITRSAPDEDKMTKRSPLDFPVEFDRNVGGARRADIFPQFSPIKPPLPTPSPGDPEEDEDEEKEDDEDKPEEDPDEKPEE